MKFAAYFIGCLIAFVGGWGAILMSSSFLSKAGVEDVGWPAVALYALSGAVGMVAGLLLLKALNAPH
jgi:hypothetical protein